MAYLWHIYGIFMACTFQKNAVTLQRIFKFITMNILGGIGLAAAIANYRKTTQEYEQALGQKETLQSAVNTYTSKRDKQFDAFDSQNPVQYDKNTKLEGLLATSILYIGNLVGKKCHMQTHVVITNTGSANIRITGVEAKVRVFGSLVLPLGSSNLDAQKRAYNELLPPGSTKEILLPGSKEAIIEGTADKEIEQAICKACGKSLITSCKKINIDGASTADIRLYYKPANGAGTTEQTSYYPNQPGVVRYCGEAFSPSKI